MKLGIINTMPASELLPGELPEGVKLERAFRTVASSLEFRHYDATLDALPHSPVECDAFLISGSARGVYDSDPWIRDLMQFVRAAYAASTKLIGVCFGHQLIAEALGGKVEYVGWHVGLHAFDLCADSPWLNPAPTRVALYFCHQDQVVVPPPRAQILAGDETCPCILYQIDDRVLGIQAHAEYDHAYMQTLVGALKPPLSPAAQTSAHQTLAARTPDNALALTWMRNFLLAPYVELTPPHSAPHTPQSK